MRSKRAATKDNECTNPIRKEQKDSEFMREEEVVVEEKRRKACLENNTKQNFFLKIKIPPFP